MKLTGHTGFLYVADCKLACGDAMRHIDRGGGRFITVLPRSRKDAPRAPGQMCER